MYKLLVNLSGVGYKASIIDSNKLQLNLGYSSFIYVTVPNNIKLEYIENQVICFTSKDKQLIGEFGSVLKALHKQDPYKNTGIHPQSKKSFRRGLLRRKKTPKK